MDLWRAVGEVLDIRSLDIALTAAWAAGYAAVAVAKIGIPNAVSKTKATKLEWDMRIVSNVHAVILLAGCLSTFIASLEYSDEEMVFGFAPGPDIYGRIFRSYLVYDFFMCAVFYSLLKDTGTLIHHVLFLIVATYALKNSLFKFQFAWLTAGELSTPFVNLRWQLAVTDRKDTLLYLWNGVCLALSFFVGRVLAYTFGLYHLLFGIRHVWVNANTPIGMYLTVAGLVAGYILNLYWFTLIARGVW
eukprot:CAMPEP_0117647956 /NCGR_PEP_ID=MMETSP0804-20121206/126_1 /TAXON_ID=1074897 /ORGANISM="Tetraselmis astigmatica, Strain CCMP880" /LENGTH=245 /DNA_ID=CAMNT_0005453483 /DNA_START=137 /DNA_END=871 /DNA_ORIENTATION=+